MLERLVDDAGDRSIPALSLSVDPENPALGLYRSLGFDVVVASGSSLAMLLTLSPGRAAAADRLLRTLSVRPPDRGEDFARCSCRTGRRGDGRRNRPASRSGSTRG
jgi:hypothetical protein